MLYKRPNSKYYYVKLKFQGRVIRKSTGCSNRRDAERVEKQLRDDLSKLRKKSGYTFGDAALRWMDEKRHKKSIATDLMILEWFQPRLENTYLSEITRDRIEELRQERLVGSSESTVNRYFALLRSILRIARKDWEWISKTPKVPLYPAKKRSPRFLTFAQFESLAKELPEHLAAPAWFAVSTGLRTKAIQSLQWDWISRDGVRFPPEVMKNNRWLTIPLGITAWTVLGDMEASRRGTVSASAMAGAGIVFRTHLGTPWTEKFTTRAWHKAAKRAGLEGVTFHDLRHTFASWKLQEGVPEHVVMALGGWESREAFKIYARFSTESLKDLAGYV